jgi:hypothetical protein
MKKNSRWIIALNIKGKAIKIQKDIFATLRQGNIFSTENDAKLGFIKYFFSSRK